MSDIIDLGKERRNRDAPDAHLRLTDDAGREMFVFSLEYGMDGKEWGARIWAYSFEDAEARVAAMRKGLLVLGEVHSEGVL